MPLLPEWIADRSLRRLLLYGERPSYNLLEDCQDRQLRRLVAHAYHRVPFYRRLYDRHGIHPSRFRGLEDLSVLPVVERRHLQEADPIDLVTTGTALESLVTRKTSGASGQPLSIRRTRGEDVLLQAVRLRALLALGLRPWDQRAHVTLTSRVKAGGLAPATAMLARRGLFPFAAVNRLLEPDDLLRQVGALRPAVLQGPGPKLAECCAMGQPDLVARIRPRFVVCGGETVTEGQRRTIEEAFQAPLFDFYGSHEFNLIAGQREPGGIYEMESSAVLGEVARPGGAHAHAQAGESGEFIGTALHSFASPFIRFRLGDDVEMEEEKNGICTKLRRVQGRTMETFATQEGARVHAYRIVNPLLTAAPWVLAYQVIQREQGVLEICVVPRSTITSEKPGEAEGTLQQQFSGQFRISVRVVAAIPPGKGGKYQTFIQAMGATPA